MRERLVSVLAGRAMPYLRLKIPSGIIPFKGDFPLLGATEFERYAEAVETTFKLEELDERNQKITLAGNKIALMEKSFKEYLEAKNIDFSSLVGVKKTNVLMEWMNNDCLSLTSLNIKL